MRTNVAGIYAAGDVPQGPNVFGDKHVTAPPWFTAVEQGKIAGANISEIDCKYEGCMNLNVTQLFGLTVASMGNF
jgi:NADPH-dependent 2,4-dienoyl-CoA reductase/sulfur reductase-like enzyme